VLVGAERGGVQELRERGDGRVVEHHRRGQGQPGDPREPVAQVDGGE
jgi:hypothetical protein